MKDFSREQKEAATGNEAVIQNEIGGKDKTDSSAINGSSALSNKDSDKVKCGKKQRRTKCSYEEYHNEPLWD